MKILRKACDKANNPLTSLLSLLAFAWLAYHSQTAETSYTASQRAAFAKLVTGNHKRQDQAIAIRDIWQLTDADIAKPVDLFGANEHE